MVAEQPRHRRDTRERDAHVVAGPDGGHADKWEGPALNAKTSEVAIEALEIAHEGLELA